MTQHDPLPADAVVAIRNVSRHFGSIKAMDQVDLRVPRGSVFGLVGVNGAGKTTLIRHVLGLLRAETGSVRVFGLDPTVDPVGVLARIGYLAEENDLPDWMRVGELIRYTQAFYPTWDEAYAEHLRRTFDLDPAAKVRHLSKGQRARTGLLLALAHRPEILVLDEPSSGLDPIVRRDILTAIIRTISDEGRTVLFSSHLLQEVERVADHVTMMHQGRIVLSDRLEQIKESHRSINVRFEHPQQAPPSIPGVLAWSGAGHQWAAVVTGTPQRLSQAVSDAGARIVDERSLSLDDIFVALVGAENLVSVNE